MADRYTVAHPFTYNGKEYKRGMRWEPEGFRQDANLIDAGMVMPGGAKDEAPAEKEAPKEPEKPTRG